METNSQSAVERFAAGEPVLVDVRGQDYLVTWYRPDAPAPDGKVHGSAGVCFTPEGDVVLISQSVQNYATWDFPAGRPEPGEDWRATLDREVLEEACAVVQDATLLGYIRGECIRGPELGQVLVRAIWRADVVVQPWQPEFEITDRLIVSPSEAVDRIEPLGNHRVVYEFQLREAMKV